jgi:transposase
MIETDKRKAVFLLHQEGQSVRQIARLLGLSRNTVRVIIQQGGVAPPPHPRADKQRLDEELLRRLYQECQGWVVRVHEKLVEEEGVTVTYSTLKRRLRELGISDPPSTRCERVPDQPGAEMQHDTTVYRIKLGDQTVRLVASLLYLRYSKRRYLKFYRAFDRFKMKCFFHQALLFWGCAARVCIIDNTNLARLRGTGANAVIVPEMEAFARQHGFEFHCHALKHCNRKAGEERSFWTVETNFLPGRIFVCLEDINQQALEWSTVRLEHRPQGKAGLIPAKAFEHERAYLSELPAHLPAPYRTHSRGIDEYGYAAFDGNFYWVPGTGREPVTVIEYAHTLKICRARECLAEYPLPAEGVKNQPFSPEGLPAPRHQPHHRKQPAQEEEKRLRSLSPSVSAYVDYILKTPGIYRHELLRKLLALSRKMTPELFIKSVERAHRYQIIHLPTLERIALLYLEAGSGELPWVQIDEAFREREAYQEGSLTELPDLSLYEIPPDHE